MLTMVKIGGVDVTSYVVNYSYERAYGDILSEIVIKCVRTVNDAVTIASGETVEVWRGWSTSTEEKIFSGYIEKYEPDGGLITITGIDELWDAVRKEVTHIYISTIDASAGKISAIFTDLMTTYAGLTADATSVQDSGTTLVLEKFVCNHADPFERCKVLAEALDWQFYYRADTDKVYFEPKGFVTNANVLTVGVDVMKVPKWNYDITEMVNNVTVIGAYQEVETTSSGIIDTTTGFAAASIDLTFEPISVKLYNNTVSTSVPLVGGVPDSTITFDYYVDKPNKKLYPAYPNSFTAGNTYEVRYSAAMPIPVNMYSQESIDAYGLFQKSVTYKDIRSVADAEARGTNYLAKYSTPFIYSTLTVKNNSTLNLAIGQKIRVVDNISVPAIDKTLVINKLRIRYPTDYDEIDVGDKFWRLADFNANVLEKLKRLEEDEYTNFDVINNLVNVFLYDPAITVENRYTKIIVQTPTAPDVFILGNADHGRLGTDELGDAGMGGEDPEYLYPGEGVFKEYFTDSEFVDTTNTTATIDTGNKRCVN